MIACDIDLLTDGGLKVFGGSFNDRANILGSIISQARKRKLQVLIEDFSNFYSCFLDEETFVSNPFQFPMNILRPHGRPTESATYTCRHLGRALRAHQAACNAVIPIFVGLHASVAEGKPMPSTRELQRLLFQKAERDRSQKFATFAQSMEPLISLQGEWADLRGGHDIFKRFNRIISANGRMLKQWLNVPAAQTLAHFQSQKVTSYLTALWIITEAERVYGKELTDANSTHYSSPYRESESVSRHGVGLVIEAQFASSLDPATFRNPGTIIAFNQGNERDAKIVEPLLHLPEEREGETLSLPPRHCLVYFKGLTAPVKGKADDFQFPPHLFEEDIAKRQASVMADLRDKCTFAPNFEDAQQAIDIDSEFASGKESTPKSKQATAPAIERPFNLQGFAKLHEFLRAIANNTESKGVAQLYKEIELSPAQGTRLVEELAEQKLIAEKFDRVSQFGALRRVLILTEKGKELINEQA